MPPATFLLGTIFPSLIVLSGLRIAHNPAAKANVDSFVLSSFLKILALLFGPPFSLLAKYKQLSD